MQEDIETLVKEDKLLEIDGIGDALAKKITEYITTGKLEYFEKLKKEIPESLLKLLDIQSLGPKKVAVVYQKLGITNVEQLRKACIEGKLRDLDGFGEITERNILRGIKLLEKTSGRVLLNVAYMNGNNYVNYLKKCKKIKRISIAGSLRRMKETIGDIDILCSSDSPEDVMDFFVKYEDVDKVLMKGPTKSSVILTDNIQVDLRVVTDESFGAALQYFTGSKEHNVTMRSIAIKKGFKLNEYGLFKKDTDKLVLGKNEEDIYKNLGLEYIDPELRENRGEVAVAKKKNLPKLIKYNDVLGDFHIHSTWSDGNDNIETIAKAANSFGYHYIGITDHSQSLYVANGLSEDKIDKKIEEIERINKNFKDLKILCGTECDIKSDGSLDYSNKILKKFDFVYIGIHTAFKMNKKEMTNRIVSGMQNENVHFLAHPTGGLIGRRDPYEVDIEQIMDVAKDTDTYLEINAFPDRLDLNDYNIKVAKEKKVKFVIGTDSHSVLNLSFMKFGIATARRGWLEKKDIINTYSLSEIESMLGEKK